MQAPPPPIPSARHITGADTGFMKGGGGGGGGALYIKCCRRQCIEACSADQSGWALVAPSRFALQVPDVRGLQVPGPP